MKNIKSIYKFQEDIYTALKRTACAFFESEWYLLEVITPRFNTLVIGPTGVGKSHIVKKVAEDMEVSFYNICVSDWIPAGGKNNAGKETFLDILQFVYKEKRGIIFIDEIDKYGYDFTTWTQSVRVELFNLIDGRVPSNIQLGKVIGKKDCDDLDYDTRESLRNELRKKLREKFLIVAGSAFQAIFNEEQRGIGFIPDNSKKYINLKKIHNMIPPELANRFSRLLVIPPLTKEDYQEMINVVGQFIPTQFKETFVEIAKQKLEGAMIDQLNCRFIERVTAELIEKDPRSFRYHLTQERNQKRKVKKLKKEVDYPETNRLLDECIESVNELDITKIIDLKTEESDDDTE